ncbi:MAG: chromosome segregation protein SMC [Pyrinomonadaceae bacterium]
MFKLQRLEITGFKSFADYTEIVFTGNGITAVVGPNGCGKSNVSDCISWVLGEQRAKSLRGGEMKDVIFQGSRDRRPGGMAEVVLHMVRDENAGDPDEEELHDIDEALSEIDEKAVDVAALEAEEAEVEPVEVIEVSAETIDTNGNGFHADAEEESVALVRAAQVGSVQTVERAVKTKRHWRPRSVALDFSPGEAVSVTRRLYLSGESEYQLNGRSCRLRDIQDLFAGTGLSGAHYAIVEQGRIGQILSAKPSDRRSLIEEAAGISKFRTRQRAAESRLESAKSNLSRISDIVSEIDKQANSLRRQAGKTRRFIALQEEFRIRLRELFAAEGRHYSTLIEQLKQELDQAVAAEKDSAQTVAKREVGFREATENARRAEESLAAVRREHANNALERDRADREHRYQSEQIVALNNRVESIRVENEAVEERISLIDSEVERLKIDEEKETAEADASRSLLIEAEKQWAEKVEGVKTVEERLEAVRGTLIQHTAAIERFDELRRQLTLNAERLDERRNGLASERDRAEQSITDHENEAARLEHEVASEREKLGGLDAEKTVVLAAAVSARETLRTSEGALRMVNEEHSRKKNRLETLHELEEKRAVYFPQVQKLFAEQAKIGVKPLGVLADFLSVDEAAETAVEMLFGPYLQTVLVSSGSDASKVSAWARDNKVGRVSTLVIAKKDLEGAALPSGSDPSIAGRLGASGRLIETLRDVFPREMSAELVDDLSSRSGSDGQILIDPRGGISVGGRLFVAGSATTEEKNASLLAFKRELSGLGQAVDKLAKKIAAAETEVEKDRRALVEQEEKTVDLQSLIIKVERGLVTLEMQERANRQEIDRANRHRTVVLAELDQLAGEAEQLQGRLADADAGEAQAEKLRMSAADEVEGIVSELSSARTEAEADAAVVSEKRTLAATSSERRKSVQYALRRLENERSDLENRLSLQNLESVETTEKIRRVRESVSQIAGQIANSDTQIGAEREQLEKSIGELDAARAAADEASNELAELNRRAAEAINARSSIEVRQTEALTELRNLNEKCVHELNQPLAEIVDEQEVAEEFDLSAARSLAEEQRQRLEGFGAINMLAVEELAEAEERLDFLTSQRQDIIDSIESAEEALREIKVRSRARFKDAFEAINKNFTQFFAELFGGGRGEMTLLEAEDILEAGIEVVAQPPGKRLQNILLLSGGEKAMTAIALVLAIFRYRPSPFCLLDEVDAPLDDANVGRFVNKIAEMSEKTQFIVITHNKRTMEAARALYGVTMQEAGVSKVVSVRFE